MRKTFIKNLYQTLCNTLVLLVLYIVLLILLLVKNVDSHMYLLVTFSLLLPVVLYFLFGFYWVFQKVVIDEIGISIMFFKKKIIQFEWNSIKSIEEASILRNPAYRIINKNNAEIHLDKRKKIKKAIEVYYNGKINE